MSPVVSITVELTPNVLLSDGSNIYRTSESSDEFQLSVEDSEEKATEATKEEKK